jgi:hypothetical protein
MYIGKTPTVGNFQVCDAISVVNGQAAYTLQVGGVNVAPESANHMLVSLNGILQKPGSSFTISGSTMTFASNLATGDVIDFVQILGNVLDLGQPSDDTVTAAKLNNDVISGQTALTAEPDDTDEFLVSDAGTIKRIDYSLIKGGGITMADQWRLTADNSMSSSGNQDIDSNWERNDNSGFGQLGTGMTESSGIFTFPSTGIYLIRIIYDVIGGSQADSAVDVKINTTVNNSDYTQQTATYASMHSNGVYSVGMAEFIFDVTDTSTHKCKFRYYRSTSGTILRGSTSQNETHATFIRLGDT